MSTFDTNTFAVRLVAETLFYDEEYGALGNLSLIDETERKERFIAAYSPEDEHFVVDEATEWEDYQPDGEDDIGYALASRTSEHGAYDSAEAAASEMMRLAAEHGLTPSITLLFEQDDVI